jgi:RNA polymerase sigma factor for flagellar operon FliA
MSTHAPSSDTLVQERITACQGMVRSIATKIRAKLPPQVELDDLISYGQLGLAEAAQHFDSNQGSQFSTYAYYRIRGAIYDGVSKMNWTPRAKPRRANRNAFTDSVLEEEAAEPSPRNLLEQGQRLTRIIEQVAVVHLATWSRDEEEQVAMLSDQRTPTPSEAAVSRELGEKLHELISQLPDDERNLIQAMYFDGLTLTDAAVRCGKSKSWCSRLHRQALQHLAEKLSRLGAGD